MLSVVSKRLKPPDISRLGFASDSCSDDKNKEPNAPVICTEVPGPKTTKLIRDLQPFQNTEGVNVFADYEASIGNFMTDVDGNAFLDLNMQLDTMPLGYNHPAVLRIFEDPKKIKNIVNRPVSGIYPGNYWAEKIKTIVNKVSPNLPNVCTSDCDAKAVENAFKAMMIAYQCAQRGQTAITEEDLKSALMNQPPGTPEITIMSFKNAEHGTTLGAMSASHSNALSKVDVPAFDWPVADFPRYKYPLDHFEPLNKAQDEQCLAHVEDLLDKYEHRNMPVAGIAVEPIQSDCTTQASADFFQGLQGITNRRGIYLMFDESRTGCGATGKFWCHEHFCLPYPVDAVVFGGKCQLAGFFHSLDLSPKQRDRIYEPWMGDPVKLYIFEAIICLIEKLNLMKQVQETGDYLKAGLMDMEIQYYDLIHSTRGLGTILAFDAQCPALRDNIVSRLRKKGVIIGQCGNQGISLRPSLTFMKRHVDIFLQKLEEVIKETELKKPKNEKEKAASSKYGPPPKPFSRPRVYPCQQSEPHQEEKSKNKKKAPCEEIKEKSVRPDNKTNDNHGSNPCNASLEDWQKECIAMAEGVEKFVPGEKPIKKPSVSDGPCEKPKDETEDRSKCKEGKKDLCPKSEGDKKNAQQNKCNKTPENKENIKDAKEVKKRAKICAICAKHKINKFKERKKVCKPKVCQKKKIEKKLECKRSKTKKRPRKNNC